jgi:flagellar hook-associated protein FlgK
MRRLLASRPSPAMAVAFIALLAALSGTATALQGKNTVDSGDIKNGKVKAKDIANGAVTGKKIKKNAVTGSKVKNGSLTGTDIQDNSLTGADINESTLGQVPSANTANSANSANTANSANRANSAADADTVVRAGFTALSEGGSTTLISRGPLSIVARCSASGLNTVAETFVATTVDGSVFSSWFDASESFGPGTAETDRQLSNDADAPGVGVDSDGWYVSADAPGTDGLIGLIGILVNADADRCQFNFGGTAL